MSNIKKNSTVRLEKDKCKGCVTCMKRCPTEAIRVRNGKAHILYDKCIACGECVRVCPNRAKRAIYDELSLINDYKYKIALPAPSLYGQFSNIDDINLILTAIKKIGFDDVVEVSSGAELVSEATRKIIESGNVKTPIISSACPAVVELVLMRFHTLSENLLPVLAPVDMAAKVAMERAKEKTGLTEEEIGIFFISPCPAKVFAIKKSFGLKSPIIKGVLSASDIYMRLLSEMKRVDEIENLSTSGKIGISWATIGGEAAGNLHEKYLAADGIENCISVLKELENGKLQDLDFIELNACPGGCVGGVLNVENPFVAKARMQALRKYLPISKSKIVEEKLTIDNFKWEEKPKKIDSILISQDRLEAYRIMSETEELLKTLPDLDCGNCGAPSCRAFAEDVVMNKISIDKCDKLLKR